MCMPEGTIDADSISLFLFCGQQGNNPFKKELGAFFFLPKAVVIGAMCHCWLCIMRIYGRRRRVVVAFGRNSSRLRTVNELEKEGKEEECVGKRGSRRRIYGA